MSFFSRSLRSGYMALFLCYMPMLQSKQMGLSGCLISLMSQAEVSNPSRSWLSAMLKSRRGKKTFDKTLVTEKIYTSMISYYIEHEAEFGFLETDGTAKNFIELNSDEYAKIKEAMALDIEQSDLANPYLRSEVAKTIREYDVPRDFREFQRRQRRAFDTE